MLIQCRTNTNSQSKYGVLHCPAYDKETASSLANDRERLGTSRILMKWLSGYGLFSDLPQSAATECNSTNRKLKTVEKKSGCVKNFDRMKQSQETSPHLLLQFKIASMRSLPV